MSKGLHNTPILGMRGVTKGFGIDDAHVQVLNGVDLTLKRSEMMALVGPSGCGKTSLLQVAGLLDTADDGYIFIEEQETRRLSERDMTLLRRRSIGFVFQFHHLMPEFTALENVMLPALADGVSRKQAKEKARDLLNDVGLSARENHRPAEMSGGEQQRVAIARALVNDPVLLLADEPTGNLDPATADQVFELLLNHVQSRRLAAIIATHNMELAEKIGNVKTIKQGKLIAKNGV